MTPFLLIVWNDVEPQLVECVGVEDRNRRARAHKREHGDEHGLFTIDAQIVNKRVRLTCESFSAAFFEEDNDDGGGGECDPAKARVSLMYRDADNYKSRWDVQVPVDVMRALGPPEMDGMYDIRTLGLQPKDIPILREYGYDQDADHPYVTIENVVFPEDSDAETTTESDERD